MSISGDIVAVGAPGNDGAGSLSGSAYVFARDGSSWAEQAKLTASDAAASDTFGYSVAIGDTTVLVGADLDDDAGDWSGSAYLFERGETTWIPQ